MRYLLQLKVKGLKTNDGCDELLLVSLDTLNSNDTLRNLVRVLRLGCLSLRSLLLGVLRGALLGLDGEGCRRGF